LDGGSTHREASTYTRTYISTSNGIWTHDASIRAVQEQEGNVRSEILLLNPSIDTAYPQFINPYYGVHL